MNKRIQIVSVGIWLLIIFSTSHLFAENKVIPRDQEPKEVQALLAQQDVLRKSFLDELYQEGKETHEKISSDLSEEQKNKMLEDFRIHRLKRLEEFQAEDSALKRQIEDARLHAK